MSYLKVSFHVFNYKGKQHQNRPPPSINLVPNRLNVQDRFVTCQTYTLVFLMVNNSWMCVAFFRWFDFDFWYFSYIMAISFGGGGSQSTRREPPTLGKKLVNFITCSCESSALLL